MTDFVGAVMAGCIVLVLFVLAVYFTFANGALLLVIGGFVSVGGIIGYVYGRHQTRPRPR